MGNICRQSPSNVIKDLDVISSQNPPIQQIQPPKPEQIKSQAPEKQEEPGQSVDQANQENETLKQEQKKLIKIDDSEVIYENVQKQEKRKSPFDFQILLSCLSDSIIFAQLQPEDKIELIDKMFYCTVHDGEMVFKQGDKASLYFIIKSGKCQIIINNEIKKTLSGSQAFEELALLYNAPRSASVKAVGNCSFWAIDKITVRKTIESISKQYYDQNSEFLKKVQFFELLTKDEQAAIQSKLINLNFKAGQIIFNEGDQADSFFIIKKGGIQIYRGGKEIRILKAGDFLEEYGQYQNTVRGATAKVMREDVTVLALARDDLMRILGDKIELFIQSSLQRWAFERHVILNKLTKLQVERIVSNMQQIQMKSEDVIIDKGQTCREIIIILQGSIKYGMEVLEKGEMFGDKFLDQGENVKLREAVIMKDKGIIAIITFKQFFEIIEGSQEQIFPKKDCLIQKGEGQKQDVFKDFQLDQLIYVKKLKNLEPGNSYLVQNKMDQKKYVLKIFSKVEICNLNLEKNMGYRKKAAELINFPLIIHFVRSFKDNNNIYFIEEYIRGIEVFHIIRDIGLLSASESQFYIGSLILCLEYLHLNQLIYRDIKPENIMIDENGFVKLCNSEYAKHLKTLNCKTYTIIGTPHYFAPEIFNGHGYTYSVDLWSLGICLYEFMCGNVPYGENVRDPYEIYEEIKKKELTFPPSFKDSKAKQLINQLLSKVPELRRGSSYDSLKNNPFFENFDFNMLINRELTPPYIPPQNKLFNDQDIQNAIEVGKLVTEEMKNDLATQDVYKPENVRDSYWDEDF